MAPQSTSSSATRSVRGSHGGQSPAYEGDRAQSDGSSPHPDSSGRHSRSHYDGDHVSSEGGYPDGSDRRSRSIGGLAESPAYGGGHPRSSAVSVVSSRHSQSQQTRGGLDDSLGLDESSARGGHAQSRTSVVSSRHSQSQPTRDGLDRHSSPHDSDAGGRPRSSVVSSRHSQSQQVRGSLDDSGYARGLAESPAHGGGPAQSRSSVVSSRHSQSQQSRDRLDDSPPRTGGYPHGLAESPAHGGGPAQSRSSVASSRHSQLQEPRGSVDHSPPQDNGHTNSGAYPPSDAPVGSGRHSQAQDRHVSLDQSPAHRGGHAHSGGRQPSQVGSGRHSQSSAQVGGLTASPDKSDRRVSTLSGRGQAESELTAGTDASSKLRPGAAVEVMSNTAKAWLPGQVISPVEDGKVTVEFKVGQETLRKSISALSEDIRPPQEPCEERRPSILSSDGKRPCTWSAAQKEAVRVLAKMQATEEDLTGVPCVKERATAAVKWNRACQIAEKSRSVELWCSLSENLNGAWLYSPTPSGQPSFQHQIVQKQWLFVATNGSWWLGDTECKEKRYARGWMRSDQVAPGTLPQDVETWEAPKSGEWEPQASAQFYLSESVDVAWQQMRVAAFKTPVIEIRGVADSLVDGLYDFVAGHDEAGEPPSFQHQQRPNLWLFVAHDQRWWIGNVSAREKKDDRGLMHSSSVHPGTHPSEAAGWHVRNNKVWEECRAIKIRKVPDAARACEKWSEARGRAENVEIWGKDYYHGGYILKDTEDGLPAYQSSADAEIWLYLAMDGCWWVADAENKDARRARGYLKSDVVTPGTLPQDVDCWKELKVNSWEGNAAVCIMSTQAVAEEWQVAWQHAEQAEIIEILNVDGPKFNGLYDLLEPENGRRVPPTFQHQVNQDLFLYVARDGRWWISNQQAMIGRDPRGRMHSDLIKPGMLPFAEGLSWHVCNRASNEWERQEHIQILV